MASFLIMPYVVVPLLLLPLSLYLMMFFFLRKDLKNIPPGSDGWPVLGENVDLAVLGFPEFIRRKMERYSHQVFRTSLLFEKMVVLCGAQGNKLIFNNDGKLITPWIPLSLQKVILPDFGDSGLKESVSIFRSFHQYTLTSEVLKRYAPVMDSLAREQLENDWQPNTVVMVRQSAKKFVFDLSCRLFLNVVDPNSVRRLSDPFDVIGKGLVTLPIDLPGTPLNRAIKASKVMRREVMKIIKERRKETEKTKAKVTDFVSEMLALTYEDGERVSDDKISNFLVGLIFASVDTTASALTSVIYFLVQHPHVYEQLLKEQTAITKTKRPDEELRWEDLEKMNYSKNVIKEALRLAPPAQGGFKEATTNFTYAGFTIPKGWKILWTPHASHNNPDYFPEPEKFDPSRFEGSGPAPNTFVPFGGGPRMCPGRNYAKLDILVFISNLVTRFRLEKAIPSEKMLFHATFPTPAHGLPLRLLPHPK